MPVKQKTTEAFVNILDTKVRELREKLEQEKQITLKYFFLYEKYKFYHKKNLKTLIHYRNKVKELEAE